MLEAITNSTAHRMPFFVAFVLFVVDCVDLVFEAGERHMRASDGMPFYRVFALLA